RVYFYGNLGTNVPMPPALIDDGADKLTYVRWFEDDWPQVAKDISRAVAADEEGQAYLGQVGGTGCDPPTESAALARRSGLVPPARWRTCRRRGVRSAGEGRRHLSRAEIHVAGESAAQRGSSGGEGAVDTEVAA